MNTHFNTDTVHAGTGPDEHTGAVTPPIHLATTYAQDDVGALRGGYEYSRSANPTRTELETAVAQLEGGRHASAFASGLAALDAVARLATDGTAVVCSNDAYGGTLRLLARLHTPRIELRAVDLTNPEEYRDALHGASLVIAETPTNPLLRVIDITELAHHTHNVGTLLAVDSTFSTPYNTKPLALGAALVVHSSTKYLGGHSDVVGGIVITNSDPVAESVAYIQNAAGAVPSPFDSYLTLRGIRTLALRMERHGTNAAAVAAHLNNHPRVQTVHYPGLDHHPQHALAATQMHTFGGMVSFEVVDAATATAVVEATRVFTLAESLGAVESLIEVPAAMTHASLVPVADAGHAVAVPPGGLIRLSVGIEHVDDLIWDLDQALHAAHP